MCASGITLLLSVIGPPFIALSMLVITSSISLAFLPFKIFCTAFFFVLNCARKASITLPCASDILDVILSIPSPRLMASKLEKCFAAASFNTLFKLLIFFCIKCSFTVSSKICSADTKNVDDEL